MIRSSQGNGFMVFDEFLECPDRVRLSALQSGFGTWAPSKGEVGSSNYTGMNFWGEHSTLLRSLSAAIGQPVYPHSMFFRVTNSDTEGAYVHSDREAGDFTAIVYLSKHAEDESGTGFYKHTETGMTSMPPFVEMAKDPEFFARFKTEMVEGKPEHWGLQYFVPGKYNRALIFDAPLFHSRLPKHGFGATPEDGRMVWACHFYL
jgi:Family of unknown function (DUF6445)